MWPYPVIEPELFATQYTKRDLSTASGIEISHTVCGSSSQSGGLWSIQANDATNSLVTAQDLNYWSIHTLSTVFQYEGFALYQMFGFGHQNKEQILSEDRVIITRSREVEILPGRRRLSSATITRSHTIVTTASFASPSPPPPTPPPPSLPPPTPPTPPPPSPPLC